MWATHWGPRTSCCRPAIRRSVAIDFLVSTNATPIAIDSFNNLPIKQVGNAVVYLRDVAYVHRGGPPQQNIVLVKGQQSILLQILKSGDASTLAVVSGVRAKLPALLKTLPPGVTITPLNDASSFVRASIADVVQEMVTAAFLAGITVLLFVGSWRSTLIVATSIPLSILSSILVLSWLGQTINVMTLGGLALAVGILVDDATVMIENINTHLEEADADGKHKGLERAIIDAANQIVVPTFVSTLCICIVWLPLLQLGGVAGYLFLPLAEAIIFAMIASFILSRTLTPTMAAWLLRGQVAAQQKPAPKHPGFFARFQAGFEARFERFRERYRAILEGARCARQVVHSPVSVRRRWRLFCCCSSPVRISSPASNRVRSICTCARRSALGSRRRARFPCWWSSRSAICCPATWWAR